MTQTFKMDEPLPRLLDETRQGLIGTPMNRPDGPLKVSGRADYAADRLPDGTAHGVLVRATITKGKVTRLDESALAGIEGVVAVLSGPNFVRNPAQGMAGESPVQPGPRVDYHGQPIALVVAETFEAARDAAQRLVVEYDDAGGAEVDPDSASEVETDDPDATGDWDEAWGRAAAKVDVTYTTPGQVSAAMEPHAALAHWDSGRLTLHGSQQMLRFNRKELADAVGVDPSEVRILSPYVGGGFGSKLGIGAEAVSAALASRDLGRPVRVVMARQTVFDAVLRRTQTSQHVRLAADADGRLLALGHDDLVSNLPEESFAEPTTNASQFTYGAAALRFQQSVARIHRTPSGSVRAPGEAVGMVVLEAAVDELAGELGMDPVELRLKNIPDTAPLTGQDYSGRRLADCLRQGAERFGWAQRPKAERDGDWLIGCGMAAAARKNMLTKAAARVRLTGAGAVVETDMTDIGTGSYAILAQIAGELLGLPESKVEVRLADTDLPGASGSGGSFGAGSTGSAVFLAARRIREQLAAQLGCEPGELTLQDGIARGANVEKSLADLVQDELVGEAEIASGEAAKSHLSAGWGAHFCEVAVHAWTGEVRVRRMLGLFDIGRVLNRKTATSQAVGGMIWGLGGALTEELHHDPRTGHIANRDLANYHVAAHADAAGRIEADFVDDRDDWANPMQSKGVGELGISGSGGAVLNAIHAAAGVRIRHLPATPDKVIAALEAAGR
ncbi:xanthine dehydrogenase family protein molybdopterin-binding subunit [Wenxinia marina]|uniref:Aerobic-type carbon monoxide dehydrogenase, large subunit CoxL/CutL-like protein n=1 Tax=Wenxinia marina DSM 24838 TaxID=1123501 RepID=A0A0D0QDL5_9RHOB|nr:xanthine dehydrogenase family protein molybdopterin-binding subunit [Wenxinia marina]KIQ69088.1 Aerobic-type carbon monoxide dehydrogenase, large subunit CoxL/CutL-like protein [Wenxinia marina DSM 24838]GGL70197.1 xanthine dehydrogenase [Wenxinia marina]